MDRNPVIDILNETQDLLVRTFNRNELRQLLLSKMEINLDEIAPNATGTNDLVFEVLTWMDRRGLLYKMINFAAALRTQISEWQSLLNKAVKSEAHRSTPSTSAPNALRGAPLPGEVIALIRGYSRLRRVLQDGDQKTVQLQAIVNQIIGLPLEDYDLADQYHLGAHDGERLLTVLTLIRRPDARYLRWLAERMSVESRFVGFQPAVALATAADALPLMDLDAVTSAINEAREWIPHNERDGGRWKKLGQALDVVTRRSGGQPRHSIS